MAYPEKRGWGLENKGRKLGLENREKQQNKLMPFAMFGMVQ
jgi:hypothetical protein